MRRYLLKGDQSEYDSLQATLEAGENMEGSIHSVANLLKIFFRSRPSHLRIFANLDAQSLLEGSGSFSLCTLLITCIRVSIMTGTKW